MHSSVLISCQYLYPGDELTVDYRLGPDLPKSYIPSWYAHVDIDGARSRLEGSPRRDDTNIVTGSNGSDTGGDICDNIGASDSSDNTGASSHSGIPTTGTNKDKVDTSTNSNSSSFKVVQR